MPIYQLGQLNTTALSAPGVYLQIQPPPLIINGVPSNLLGIVGVGSWGPVNSPTLCGGPGDTARFLGSNQVRKYDLATAQEVCWKMGATAIMYVRVTDGTDTAATLDIMDSLGTPVIGLALTMVYTGSGGNGVTGFVTAGTKAGSYKLTISKPGTTSEVYDNLVGTGAALWAGMASAVNNGQSSVRGPSALCVGAAGTSVSIPNITSTFTATGGTDGVTGVTDSTLVGLDGVAGTRKGMYCLRSTGAQVGALIDHSTSTDWPTILALGLSEGIYFGDQSPPGTAYAATSTLLNTAGADGYGLKLFVGDWVYYFDATNNQQRLLAPSTFWAAFQSALSPDQSSLNQEMLGFVGTQRVAMSQPYTSAEIGAAKLARLDLITNPSPGGNYYACQTGVNASSNAAANGDNYTRMTNYLAITLASAFGSVVGKNQTTDLRLSVQNAIQSFLTNLWQQGMIGDVNNPTVAPFTVQINAANNSAQSVESGYMIANVSVKYLSVVYYFVINLQGGQTVTIQSSVNSAI